MIVKKSNITLIKAQECFNLLLKSAIDQRSISDLRIIAMGKSNGNIIVSIPMNGDPKVRSYFCNDEGVPAAIESLSIGQPNVSGYLLRYNKKPDGSVEVWDVYDASFIGILFSDLLSQTKSSHQN